MNAPTIDPTMHVYCPTHSERPGHDGGKAGPQPATYGVDEWGRRGYTCWHCAREAWEIDQATRDLNDSFAIADAFTPPDPFSRKV